MRRMIFGNPRFPVYNRALRAHLIEDEGERGTALCGRAFYNRPGGRQSVIPASPDNKLCVWCWRIDEGLFTPSPTALANRNRWKQAKRIWDD